MNRSENMKSIRAKYYDRADPETRRAWRVKGGANNVNRHKFDKDKAREAANKRWHGGKEENGTSK